MSQFFYLAKSLTNIPENKYRNMENQDINEENNEQSEEERTAYLTKQLSYHA